MVLTGCRVFWVAPPIKLISMRLSANWEGAAVHWMLKVWPAGTAWFRAGSVTGSKSGVWARTELTKATRAAEMAERILGESEGCVITISDLVKIWRERRKVRQNERQRMTRPRGEKSE